MIHFHCNKGTGTPMLSVGDFPAAWFQNVGENCNFLDLLHIRMWAATPHPNRGLLYRTFDIESVLDPLSFSSMPLHMRQLHLIVVVPYAGAWLRMMKWLQWRIS